MSLALKIAKNTAYLTIGKIISTILGVLAVALVLRYLSPDDYGRYTTIFAFIMLFGTLTDFGLNLTTTQDISTPGAEVERTLANVFTFRLAANIILLGLIPFLLAFFPYESVVKQGILLSAILFFSLSLFQVLASYFQKTLEALAVAASELIGKIILLILTIVAVWLQWPFLWIIVTVTTGAVGQFLALLVWTRRRVKIYLAFDWPIWQRILIKTWPIAISVVLTTIYFKGDTLILSLTRPYHEVGIYGAAYKILEVLIALPILFMGLVLPILTASFGSNDLPRFRQIMQKAWDGLALATLPLVAGGIALASPIVKIVAGPGYANAGPVLQLLMIAVGAIFLGALFTHAIVAVNQQRRMIKYYGLTAVLAVILYWRFIPVYSYYAAATITILAELVIALSAAYKVSRAAPLSLSWRVFAKALLSALIMGLTLYPLSEQSVFITVPLGVIVYAALVLLFRAIPTELLFSKK